MNKKYPSDPDAERAILGALMLEPERMNYIKTQVTADMFTTQPRQHLFKALLELHNDSIPFDYTILGNKLKNNGGIEVYGGLAGLMRLLEQPTASNVGHYSDIVKRANFYRMVIDKAEEIIDAASKGGKGLIDVMSSAQELFKEYATRTGRIDTSLASVITTTQHRVAQKMDCIPWGLSRIDKRVGGVLRRQPIIVAGRPSHLKTTLVCSPIPYWVDTLGLKVMVLSLEVSADMYIRKIVCQKESINSTAVNNFTLTAHEMNRFLKACDNVGKKYEGKLSIIDAKAGAKNLLTIEHAARKFKPDIIIVDYLGLIPTSKLHRRIETEQHLLTIKDLAIDIDAVPIIVVQISRAPMNKTQGPLFPRLQDLKESGAIEENACQCYLLYYHYTQTKERKDVFRVQVDLAKNKYGPLGLWQQYYDPAYCTIKDLGFNRFDIQGKEKE